MEILRSCALIFLCLAATGGVAAAELPPPPPSALTAPARIPAPHTPPGVEVDSASLVENARLWDGREISFTGEAIGEAMVRGGHAWIHLNDDAYMWKNIEEGAELGGYNSGHAVWIPASLAGEVRFFGDYKHEGDVVRVTGRFNAACPQHGGDMDIHADQLMVLRTGHAVEHKVNTSRLALGLLLLVVSLVLLFIKKAAERRRI